MSKRTSGFERRDRDFYPTPAKAVLPLVPHLRAARIRRFAEPCCGEDDLARHLEAAGLICTYAGDIATGQDALDVESFDAPVITNPPYERKLMHRLIAHFIATAPCSWLLLEYDWSATRQARPFLPHCSDIVMVGRLRWIEDSPHTGLDNFAWMRFSAGHNAGPILHTGLSPARTGLCPSCGQPFRIGRADQKFCGDRCRQRAHRGQLAVT